jgi:hypothetical protein
MAEEADPKQTVHDAAIREASSIDPAIVAAVLGFLIQRQRKPGLRKCKQNPRKADRCDQYGGRVVANLAEAARRTSVNWC